MIQQNKSFSRSSLPSTKTKFSYAIPRVLKTSVLLFLSCINVNYCNSHLKNVGTIKTMTLNAKLEMTLMTSENFIIRHSFSEAAFLKSMANYAFTIIYKISVFPVKRVRTTNRRRWHFRSLPSCKSLSRVFKIHSLRIFKQFYMRIGHRKSHLAGQRP